VGRARKAKQKTRTEAARPRPPGAPAPDARTARIAAAVVFAVALAAYALTLAPTVTLVDSGELIVAARGLGVAHPPGFPLYVLLGHAASRVPLGNVAQRLNALSALCAAAAAAALALVTRQALRERADGTEDRGGWISATPALTAGLLLAFSRTVWAYATVTEVYTLSTLAVVVLIGLALRARAAGTAAALAALAAAYGLATGTHHVTIALAGPALLALAWRPLRARGSPRLVAALAAVGVLCALAAYAYLPWAAARDRFPNWGDPRTLERLWWHVSGRQYQVYLSPSLAGMGQEAQAYGRALLREFGPAWFPAALALAALGFRAAWTRSRAVCAALCALVALDLAYALLYTIAEDKDAYYLPSVVALCLAAGLGAHEVLSRASRRRAAWALALVAVPLAGGALHARAADRSRFFVAHDFARDALASVGPGGLLLTSEWQLYSPLLYFQEVEGWRPDVMAVDVSLLRRSWYVDGLRAKHAGRWAPLRAEADAFLEDLRAWEHDPQRYERDPSLGRRINDRFQAMVLALCAASASGAHATSDVVLPQSPDPSLAERLARAFPLTPRGLLFSLRAPRDADPPPDLRPRGLFDGTLARDPDDVATLKVRPVYVSMMANRGRYLLAQGDRAGAEAAYRQALAWDPAFPPARAALGRQGTE
jgi:tetratricopeptide (TPR) repeat protein